MGSMMMVVALPLVAPLRALTLSSSSSSSSLLTIQLSSSSSQSEYYQGPVSIPSSTGSYFSCAPLVCCGRGDKKTAKGKRFRHSFGNSRPRNKNKGRGPPRIPVPARAPKQEILVEEEEVEEEDGAVPSEEVAKTDTGESIV